MKPCPWRGGHAVVGDALHVEVVAVADHCGLDGRVVDDVTLGGFDVPVVDPVLQWDL
jgi:hypothetical protein